jgi:hypothetical protein
MRSSLVTGLIYLYRMEIGSSFYRAIRSHLVVELPQPVVPVGREGQPLPGLTQYTYDLLPLSDFESMSRGDLERTVKDWPIHVVEGCWSIIDSLGVPEEQMLAQVAMLDEVLRESRATASQQEKKKREGRGKRKPTTSRR